MAITYVMKRDEADSNVVKMYEVSEEGVYTAIVDPSLVINGIDGINGVGARSFDFLVAPGTFPVKLSRDM